MFVQLLTHVTEIKCIVKFFSPQQRETAVVDLNNCDSVRERTLNNNYRGTTNFFTIVLIYNVHRGKTSLINAFATIYESAVFLHGYTLYNIFYTPLVPASNSLRHRPLATIIIILVQSVFGNAL